MELEREDEGVLLLKRFFILAIQLPVSPLLLLFLDLGKAEGYGLGARRRQQKQGSVRRVSGRQKWMDMSGLLGWAR